MEVVAVGTVVVFLEECSTYATGPREKWVSLFWAILNCGGATLNEFVKSILNYYAAFTETRFSSSSTLNYKWSNDPNFTLDISFFPEFRGLWLDKLSTNDKSPVEIGPRQFKIEIPPQNFKQKLAEHLESTLNFESLKTSVSQERDKQSGEG